jgi:Bacterial capsule synthesis protein PGA_cap
MRVHRAELRRRQVRRRRIGAAAVLAAVLLATGTAAAALLSDRGRGAAPAAAQTTRTGDANTSHASSQATTGGSTAPAPPGATGAVSISAVGDTMLGYAGSLAPSPGTYFDAVRPAIAADVAFANLEGTLTDQTSGKCASLPAGTCFEFRVPPSFARYFKAAGFTMMSNANNHAFDFWQAGLDDTVAALDAAGLDHTGRTTEITYVTVHGIRLAFIGAGPYPNTGPLNDYPAIRRLVQTADRHAQLVVVAMHAGAEGSGATHLTGRDEIYYGENRGNPEAFARTAVDAGADLVLGSGPHVLRGMEFYRGRLIAYSLGDFAGFHNFTTEGELGVSAILRVKLDQDGRFLRGKLVSVRLVGAGQPVLDPSGAGASLVATLSREDLGPTAARIAADGTISPR